MPLDKRPIITHIITGLSPGGAENFLLKLISSLKDFRHHVISLAPQEDNNFARLFHNAAESVTSLNLSTRNIFQVYKVFSLIKLLKQQAPDLVQTWMYHANLLGGIAAKANKIPVIWNIRNSSLSKEVPEVLKLNTVTNYIVKAGALLSNYIPDSIICCSHDAATLHQSWGYEENKFMIIPNGIDTERFRLQPELKNIVRKQWNLVEAKVVIGFVGRFHPQKDLPNFIKAARLFLLREPGARFVLCGTGITDENPIVKKLIENEGLCDRCHLLGKISSDEVHRVYNALDLLCLPSSYGEAFPNVIAEAMACGVPCVGTDVGDTSLIIGDQGLIVPPKQPASLSEAWHKLLSASINPSAIRQRILDNFTLSASGNAYRGLYRDKISKSYKKLCTS
jgi:glycosyltransferase involved in cell wall biosynthesis